MFFNFSFLFSLHVLFIFLFSGAQNLFFCLKKATRFLIPFLILRASFLYTCWHKYQSLTVDVSSVVGAAWRCGVLTTQGGIAGIGLGRLLGGEHDSPLQSGVEAPRLLKRSLSRLCYCCCGCGCGQSPKSTKRDARVIDTAMCLCTCDWTPGSHTPGVQATTWP